MNLSVTAPGGPYQASAPPPSMYSGQQLQPTSYSGQQPPPMAAAAETVAWGHPQQTSYNAESGQKLAPQAYGDPIASGAYPQSSAPGYAVHPGTAQAFYPPQAYYQQPQQSVNVAVSTAPIQSAAIVYQPRPVVTTMGIIKSYMAWSLVNLIVFCWPLGIPALVYSLKVKSAMTAAEKSKYSLMARNFNIAATVVGAVLIIVLASTLTSIRTTHYTYYTNTYYYYYYYNSYYYYYG